MHLTYFSLGIKKGDEVIVPAQTHISTAHAVELTGAKPVFVDCIPETGNIDISKIEEKKRTTESTRFNGRECEKCSQNQSETAPNSRSRVIVYLIEI